MVARDMDMRALDGTFQQRPEALDAVGMVAIANPFVLRVVDGAVLESEPPTA